VVDYFDQKHLDFRARKGGNRWLFFQDITTQFCLSLYVSSDRVNFDMRTDRIHILCETVIKYLRNIHDNAKHDIY